MIVVIIFATNSYAYQGIRRTTEVVKKTTTSGREFINNDLKNFSQSINNSIYSLNPMIFAQLNGLIKF
jgi:hypothetical protein